MTSSCTKHPIDHSSGSHSGSSVKTGIHIHHQSVDEESSDSDEDQEMQQEDPKGEQSPRVMDLFEFNPKNFYWLFNPDLKFNKRAGFHIDDDINPNDFMDMRRLNRKVLTHFF